MIPYFQDLAERIELAWLARNYDEEIFPELALNALEQDPPKVGVTDIVDWIFSSFQSIRQPDNRELFGEPPLMLFQAPRFYIEALFWFSGTTAIHEHSFSGAFLVVAGSSVHSHWRFFRERAINSRMLCGRLERVSTEILRPGTIRPIYSGDRLIHQLFHLEMPSVTIVVRTYEDRQNLPQYRYLPPGLAIDHEEQNGLRTRRLMLLGGMARGHFDGFREYAVRLVLDGDIETILGLLLMLTRRKVHEELLDELYDVIHERHGGDIARLFRKVCEEERRTRIVTALRSKIHDPGARFLLALLMLLPDRDAILETIRLQFPDSDPLIKIEMWLAEISGRETLGFDFSEVNRSIFRSLVEGLDEEALLQRLRSEFRNDSIEAQRDRLIEHAKKVARSDLLRPLLSGSPLGEVKRV